jgi:heme/copper-type cytochrome/quinol oxidase subunit 2
MLAKLKFSCRLPNTQGWIAEMMRWLPEDVSTYGHEIDSLFFLIYYITAATFVLVTVLMVVFLVMYRE